MRKTKTKTNKNDFNKKTNMINTLTIKPLHSFSPVYRSFESTSTDDFYTKLSEERSMCL